MAAVGVIDPDAPASLQFDHPNTLPRTARTSSGSMPLSTLTNARPGEVEDGVKGTTFKHRIAEIHAISMKRLSKVETADDPADGADDE